MVSQGPRREADGSSSFRSGLAEIYRRMPAAERRQFYLLLALMFVGAGAELATIGAVLPFLSILADPATIERYPIAVATFDWLGAATVGDRLIAAGTLFSLIVLFAGGIRFQLARSMHYFAYQLAHELIADIQRRFLFQPYSFHTQRNTSSLITALDKAEILVFEVLIPLMQAIIATFIALFIIAALVIVDPATAIISAAAFAAIYLLVSRLTRARLARNSAVVSRGFNERLRIAQESLGGIRDVIIDGTQPMYLAMFKRENLKLSRARADTAAVASAPRYLIETAGIVAIAAIALVASQREGGFAAALPALGAIALGAQRLLPLLQQVYRSWSSAAGYLSVVGQTVELLRLPLADELMEPGRTRPLPMREAISVEEVGFTYPGRRRPALDKVTFAIPFGSAVAIVGETGSGKSTLADLLMGLLDPEHGAIRIDGEPLDAGNRQRWQRSIAHVPQSIFLADASIVRNIALGTNDEKADLARVMEAARTAQLHDFVTSLAEGYDTFVGERGVRLSGGQRQRLGIARALYKQAPVLVLDEATSALDEATEAAVMDGLYRLGDTGRTIIIVAHRLSTIARCDMIVRLNEGRIVDVQSLGVPPRARPRSSRQS